MWALNLSPSVIHHSLSPQLNTPQAHWYALNDYNVHFIETAFTEIGHCCGLTMLLPTKTHVEVSFLKMAALRSETKQEVFTLLG